MNQWLLMACAVAVSCGPAKSALSDVRIGHCSYTGPNSRLSECKDYLGAWKVADAEADCRGLKGAFEGGSICAPTESLGVCLITSRPEQTRTYIISSDTTKCAGGKTGCEVFGGGVWEPSTTCGGVSTELVVLEGAFAEPVRVCKTPGPGEPPGKSANGQVCAWQSIHGATEEGRSFRADLDCDKSRSGRPYYAKDPDPRVNQPDARRSDAAYLAEEAWVKAQINATSCVCCHSQAAPGGAASIFDIDRPGSLANQLTDRGIAHGSGLVNSIPLGAFPPEQNNGFAKSDLTRPDLSIFLSTDPARMKRFWEGEIAHRGLTAADFVGVPDGFGPLSDQRNYQPEACKGAEGIAADGTITWGNGRARYVYVLEPGGKMPTVFPNLDLPKETLWRLDVPPTGTPLSSGTVKYGVAPEGTRQRFPAMGAPAALVRGRQYTLYVTADQMLPITRCLITAP